MGKYRICAGLALALANFAFAQQPAANNNPKQGKGQGTSQESGQADLKAILEVKVKAEWDAFQKKDKKAYSDLLDDDFVAVEDDGDGARNKTHSINEIPTSNIHNYTLSFFKLLPLPPDAALVTYEITMEFPTKAVNRYKRVIISELWIRHDGQWKARHYQETRVK